ncbi:hypothetical protein EUX98_g5011 [Antrodiella citrinella]|uniref:Protein kinase domain-containing protein n=1 Tax=Antrodiella citrinella TaxID=2447956 RepID=A0A4S4MV24_9APHY|nr:hypothetical protein EUX98_g5011 [Antrodiella citrinella]
MQWTSRMLDNDRKTEIVRRIDDAVRGHCNLSDITRTSEDVRYAADVLWERIKHLQVASNTVRKEATWNLLEQTCLEHNILPREFYLDRIETTRDKAVQRDYKPHSIEGIGEVHTAKWGKTAVALKRFFFSVKTAEEPQANDQDSKIHKAFSRTALRLSLLKHKNVQEFLGVCCDAPPLSQTICMVTPWCPRKDIEVYVSILENDSQQQQEVVPLINNWVREIAVGLAYLHDQGVTHGNLHLGNILIDEEGCARLTDFGLEWIAEAAKRTRGPSSHPRGGPYQYMAPEQLNPEAFGIVILAPTFSSDMYAYACACYQLYAAQLPFQELTMTESTKSVLKGVKPSRPIAAGKEILEKDQRHMM